MATSGTFTSVSGSWTATRPTAKGSSSADATWIGIGGVTKTDLIQAGTANVVDAAGNVTTTAFYELLPAAAQNIISMTVNPGDSMTSTISYAGGKWTISITDVTTGQNFTKVLTYASSFSSVEWIQEAPTNLSGSLYTLDGFGTASFSRGSAVNNGASTTIFNAGVSSINMVDSTSKVIAKTLALGSDGASFSVVRQ